jgi:hypothetical protein
LSQWDLMILVVRQERITLPYHHHDGSVVLLRGFHIVMARFDALGNVIDCLPQSPRFSDEASALAAFESTLPDDNRQQENILLRQIVTTASTSIKVFLQDYRNGAGPKVVARFVPGADVVEIIAAQGRGDGLQVQTPDQQWHRPFACYKEIQSSSGEAKMKGE